MAENAPLALLLIHPAAAAPLPDSSPTLSGRMFGKRRAFLPAKP